MPRRLAPRPRPWIMDGPADGAASTRTRNPTPPQKEMKSFFVLVAAVLLVWFLVNIKNRAVDRVTADQRALAAERAKAKSELSEEQELDRISTPAATAPRKAAVDAVDTTPIHFLSPTPSGSYAPVGGPLTFPARGPVRIQLDLSVDAVAGDMPNPAQRPDEPPRPDVRIANLSFQVTADREGAARAAPFRAFCSLTPEASIISVELELGGGHDAMDAESKRIYAKEIAGTIDQAEARRQLEALHDAFLPNAKGTYQVRADYRNGRLVSAPVTVVITE